MGTSGVDSTYAVVTYAAVTNGRVTSWGSPSGALRHAACAPSAVARADVLTGGLQRTAQAAVRWDHGRMTSAPTATTGA